MSGLNLLVMQSGGCTPVINRSLYGIASAAYESGAFDEVIGARHGVEGLLREDLINLNRLSKTQWSRIAKATGAALGSTRTKLRLEQTGKVVDVLSRHKVSHLLIIGGNDSAETGQTISNACDSNGLSLSVMHVPKTVDNDLTITDHSPGFGSAARFLAFATMGAGQDALAMGQASPITIMEVMGRDTGWLAASSALGKREEADPPHFVWVPEFPATEDQFVSQIENAYRRFGFAVAVVAENSRTPEGVIGDKEEPWYVDDFGHPYYDGPARYLASLVSQHLNIRVRYEKPGTIQRSFAACLSPVDIREAEQVGRAAVRYAPDGQTGQMVTLVREPAKEYHCDTGLAGFEEVAGKVMTLPASYFDTSANLPTGDFLSYVRPLIGTPGIPRFVNI